MAKNTSAEALAQQYAQIEYRETWAQIQAAQEAEAELEASA